MSLMSLHRMKNGILVTKKNVEEEYWLNMQEILVKYALLKVHLLDWKCHYFTRGGRGLERTTLSLSHFVTIGLEGFPKGLVRVRGWSDDGQVSFR